MLCFSVCAFAAGSGSYTISLNSNGGSSVSSVTKYWNQSASLPTPTRSGYTFTGWAGTVYSNTYVADYGPGGSRNGQTLYLEGSNSVWPATTLGDSSLSADTIEGLVRRGFYYADKQSEMTSAAVNTWVGALRSGSTGVFNFYQALWANRYSSICASCMVDRLYASLLNRDADFAGKCQWVGEASGYSYDAAIDGIIHSSEFINRASRLGVQLIGMTSGSTAGLTNVSSARCSNSGHNNGYPSWKGGRRFTSIISSSGVVQGNDSGNYVKYRTELLDKQGDNPNFEAYHKSVPAYNYNHSSAGYFRWLVDSFRSEVRSAGVSGIGLCGTSGGTASYDSGTGCYYNVSGLLSVNKWLYVNGSAYITGSQSNSGQGYKTFSPGQSFPSQYNAPCTLTAQWRQNSTPTVTPTPQPTSRPTAPPSQSTYWVYYNANGGSGGPSSGSGTSGSTYLIASGEPTRSGYTFLGWSTSSSGSAMYNYNAYGSYTGPMTDRFTLYSTTYLYAIWERQNTDIWVYYNANGGSGGPSSGRGTYGGTYLIASGEPSRSGYTFLGWSTSSSGSAMYNYNAYGSYTGPMTDRFTLYSTTYLYAIWQHNATTYIITYNPNGGSGGSRSYSVNAGATHSIISWEPTRTGYSFLGWSSSASAASASYTYGDGLKVNGNRTLYAVWKAEAKATYTIRFDANGGEGAPEPQTKTEGEPLTLTTETPTKEGYEFLAWNTVRNGGGASYAPGDRFSVDADTTLYAQWKVLNTLDAAVKNTTYSSPRKGENTFLFAEKGTVSVELSGEVTQVVIRYPSTLQDYADSTGKDKLEDCTLTPGDGLEADGSAGAANFYIPVNFPEEKAGSYIIEVVATFADGESITKRPTLEVLSRAGQYLFKTRLLWR